MWDGDIPVLRAQYAFGLAHLCHQGEEQVLDMTVTYFGLLIRGIDEFLAVRQRGAWPDGAW